MVTYDVDDFAMLHDAWFAWSRAWNVTALHAGILLIQSSAHLGSDEVAGAIHELATVHDTIDDRAFVWSRRQGWQKIHRQVSRR